MSPRGLTAEDRFWLKTIQGTVDDCWVWDGAMSGEYGKLFIKRDATGRTITEYAHRFSWRLENGPIPRGMEIDHLCDNGCCVNPNHLECVTPDENKRRQGARQTQCVHGHPYTIENTYVDKRGNRRCRACAVERRAA